MNLDVSANVLTGNLDLAKKQIELAKESNLYIESKKEGEKIIMAAGLPYIILRPSLLYGPGDKKNIILSVYKPPVYVGLLSLFGENFYQFSLSALEDSKVCLIELDWFKKLITLNGNFGLEVITYLSQSANYILHNKIKMGQKQMRGKVASVVLFFYRNIFEKLDFTLPITRKEMAEFAGLSTENLITALSEFRKDKLIEVDGKKINILNAAGLEEISNHY